MTPLLRPYFNLFSKKVYISVFGKIKYHRDMIPEKTPEVMQKIKNVLPEAPSNLVDVGAKSSFGFIGALTAMSINEIAGLIVAILTAIYMLLQIEAAVVKRKERKSRQGREAQENK